MSAYLDQVLSERDVTDNHDSHNAKRATFQTGRHILLLGIAFISATIITLCVLIQGTDGPSVSSLLRQANQAHCGNTTTSARSLGCQFDPMSFSWLPSACYDAELTAQFLSLRPWQWYDSVDGTAANMSASAAVSQAEVLLGEHDYLYVSWQYHELHCTYMWRKMHRAMLGIAEIDAYIGNYHHTAHCEEILTRKGMAGGEKGLTVIRRKFVERGLPLS